MGRKEEKDILPGWMREGFIACSRGLRDGKGVRAMNYLCSEDSDGEQAKLYIC